MKKRLFLTFVMVFVFALMLAFAVSADTVHNENTVDYSATVTLDDGTELELFDNEGNALIWYINAAGELKSISANDSGVSYTINNGNMLNGVEIVANGETVEKSSIVVFNVINVDAVAQATVVSGLFNSSTTIQYAYLHLNTVDIRDQCFKSCSNLKHVNLKDLTNLKYIGANGNSESNNRVFQNCGSLFAGEVLDLSNTVLDTIYSKENFQGVGFTGVKLPDTIRNIGDGTFNGTSLTSIVWPKTVTHIGELTFGWCPQLTSVCLSSDLTSMRYTAFRNATNLNTIFYCGTRDQFINLLSNIKINSWENGGNIYCLVGGWGPCGMWPVIGAATQDEARSLHESLNGIVGNPVAADVGNLISYAEYQKLTDEEKSINKYVVYNYSSCEAYNDGVHTVSAINDCVSVCSICGVQANNHADSPAASVAISYTSYLSVGTKTITCKNEGCTYSETVDAPALFTCVGYSAPENGRGGIAIGYTVNNEAIIEYEKSTGKTLKYGVFAAAKEKLGDSDIFDSNGKVAENAIAAEISGYKFVMFELKIVGFTDEYKDALLAIGAYAKVTDGESTEYAYMQPGTPNENEKYCFVSYNDVLNSTK